MDDHLNVEGQGMLAALGAASNAMHSMTSTAEAELQPDPGYNRVGSPPSGEVPVNWPPALAPDLQPTTWDSGRGADTSEPASWESPLFAMPPGQEASTPEWTEAGTTGKGGRRA